MGHLPDDVGSWTIHCINLVCDGELLEDKKNQTYTCEDCGKVTTLDELNEHLEKEAENYLKFFGYK